MPIDIGSFIPTEVIFHKIPKAKLDSKHLAELEIAEATIALSPRLIRYFRERIIDSLHKRFDVVYDAVSGAALDKDNQGHPVSIANSRSPIPELLVEFFRGDGSNFISASAEMARHLYLRQKGGSNEGMLVLVEGVLHSGKPQGKCLVILKLEPSEALTIDSTKTATGKKTFDVQVHDVAFEKKARVFKAALFTRASSLAKIAGYVSDPQNGGTSVLHGNDVADFFLGFLGCQFRETADLLTKEFMEYVDDFANTIEDDATKATFVINAMAAVQSTATAIDPEAVASSSLPATLQDAFLSPLRHDDGSIPFIPKDLTRLGHRLENVVAQFEGGIKVFGPREAMDEHFTKVNGLWQIDTELRNVRPAGRS
jgi:hypothetical protein